MANDNTMILSVKVDKEFGEKIVGEYEAQMTSEEGIPYKGEYLGVFLKDCYNIAVNGISEHEGFLASKENQIALLERKISSERIFAAICFILLIIFLIVISFRRE